MEPTSPPQLRAARTSDAQDLARLRYEFRTEVGRAEESAEAFTARCAAWMEERLRAGSAWRCRVAVDGEAKIGMVWLQLIEKLPNPVAEPERHGYLSSLYVVPDRRASGTGSALLEAALQVCHEERVDAILLWPTPRSRSLYERHGFRARDDLLLLRPDRP